MKSKVQFDLNGSNEFLIKAQIENSDDVRDKVAARFVEELGHSSNLAAVRIYPRNEISIVSFRGDMYGSEKIASELCSAQLENIFIAALKELKQRRFNGYDRNCPPNLEFENLYTSIYPEIVKKADSE